MIRKQSEVDQIKEGFNRIRLVQVERRLVRNTRRREYVRWLELNMKRYNNYDDAPQAVSDMACAFPELCVCRGVYHCYTLGDKDHIWLSDSFRNVIDPVAGHFPSKGDGGYELHSETKPTGVCPECGAIINRGQLACSLKCFDLLLERLYKKVDFSGQ